MQWIMPQIKAALNQGDRARVAELQAELRGVELSIAPVEVLGGGPMERSEDSSAIKKQKKRMKKQEQIKPVIESETTKNEAKLNEK